MQYKKEEEERECQNQRYDNTPLGRSLANTITLEVLKCFLVLQDLFNNVDGTWLDFNITTIGGLCRQIWWDLWDGDQFALLRSYVIVGNHSKHY
jgi:hypothetical protein